MTTYYAFQAPPNNNFSFQPTLDGQICQAITWFNTAAQRYYVSVTKPDGSSWLNLPLLGSLAALNLQSLTWQNGVVTGVTAAPHGFVPLQTINLTVSGASPASFNGVFSCFILDGTTFTYEQPTNPGTGNGASQLVNSSAPALTLGTVSYDINIGAGYFDVSTLVYRKASQMFEVTP